MRDAESDGSGLNLIERPTLRPSRSRIDQWEYGMQAMPDEFDFALDNNLICGLGPYLKKYYCIKHVDDRMHISYIGIL